jgi:hypothetical protein
MSPSAFSTLFQSTTAQVVAFSAIAAGLSQMASPARPELPDELLVTPVVRPVSTDPGSVNAELSEPTRNDLFAHSSTPSVSDMPEPRLPAGLIATTSPIAPRTATDFLPDSPPQKIARKQNLRSGPGSQTKSTFSVPQVAQVKPWFRDDLEADNRIPHDLEQTITFSRAETPPEMVPAVTVTGETSTMPQVDSGDARGPLETMGVLADVLAGARAGYAVGLPLAPWGIEFGPLVPPAIIAGSTIAGGILGGLGVPMSPNGVGLPTFREAGRWADNRLGRWADNR